MNARIMQFATRLALSGTGVLVEHAVREAIRTCSRYFQGDPRRSLPHPRGDGDLSKSADAPKSDNSFDITVGVVD